MDDDSQPSTSKGARSRLNKREHDFDVVDDYDDDELVTIKDEEEEEIARLQLPDDDDANKQKAQDEDDERIAKIPFSCKNCDMDEMVHYYGQEPPFVYGLKFLEDTYVMRDPFQPPPPRGKSKPEYFIAIGAKCFKCERPVCRASACSIFYTNTYCLDCAAAMERLLPAERMENVKANRKRAENFSTAEVDLLLDCIYTRRHIIENKKTDAITSSCKENAWRKITEHFNSFAIGTKRDTTSLRLKYSNLKKYFKRNDIMDNGKYAKEVEQGKRKITSIGEKLMSITKPDDFAMNTLFENSLMMDGDASFLCNDRSSDNISSTINNNKMGKKECIDDVSRKSMNSYRKSIETKSAEYSIEKYDVLKNEDDIEPALIVPSFEYVDYEPLAKKIKTSETPNILVKNNKVPFIEDQIKEKQLELLTKQNQLCALQIELYKIRIEKEKQGL